MYRHGGHRRGPWLPSAAGGPMVAGWPAGLPEFGPGRGQRWGDPRLRGAAALRRGLAAMAGPEGPEFAGPEFAGPRFGPEGGPPPGPGGRGPFGRRGPGGPHFGPEFGPGWRPGRHGGRGPGRGRRQRGDIRIAVLALLAEEPRHGYALITRLGELTGGLWRPSPGSIYPILQQLQDEGLVAVDEAEGRRVFSLTEAGRAELDRLPADQREPWKGLDEGGEGPIEMMRSTAALGVAADQVARLGDADQRRRGLAVLEEARRALYRILAEDGAPPAARDAAPGPDEADPAAAPGDAAER